MGGRTKSRRMPKKPAKIKQKIIFDCVVCGFKDCVMIKINKGYKVAKLECDRCETRFKLTVKRLDEPIDVYHEWLRRLKSKSIVPFPGRLDEINEDDYDSEGNEVEQLLKENKQNKRKRIKRNIELEDDEDKQLSDDSLIQKQKVEDIDDISLVDSKDESYNVKGPKKKNKKKK